MSLWKENFFEHRYISNYVPVKSQRATFLFVNPLSPPVCPSCQGANTILQGLNIISQFFRSSAPAINFGGVLHKALCNVFFRHLFFWPLLANGSWGKFLAAVAAVDIHMLMKGAPCSSPAVGVQGSNKPKQVNGRLGWRDQPP